MLLVRFAFFIFVSLAALVFFSDRAEAACGINFCDNERILHLRTNFDGTAFIEVSGDKAPLNCTLREGRYMTLDPRGGTEEEREAANRIYAMLLSVQASGKPLGRIRLFDNDPNCKVLYTWQLDS